MKHPLALRAVPFRICLELICRSFTLTILLLGLLRALDESDRVTRFKHFELAAPSGGVNREPGTRRSDLVSNL